MFKRIGSYMLAFCLIFSLFSIPVMGLTVPNIYKDSVSVKVGSTVNLGFTYGDSATSAELILSNLKIDAYISGNTIYVKGLTEGIAYVTLNFNDGTTDSVAIEVVGKNGSVSNTNNSDYEIRKGSYENIYIDLDSYDATKATITYESKYVSVNKTSFTSSGNLKVTGKLRGDTTLKVKYNTGDIDIYNISVIGGSSSNNSDIEIEVGDYENYYIDLDMYNADRATISYDSNYVDVNKTTFSSSGNLKIYGESRGSSEIKIKYDSGEVEYLYVDVVREKDNTVEDYTENLDVSVGETITYYIDLDMYGANKATISYDSNVDVNKTTFTSSGNLKITGVSRGDCNIKIRYSSGDVEYLYVDVLRNNNKYEDPTVSVDEIEIEKDESQSFYIYLGDCKKATLSLNNSYATVNNSVVYRDSKVKITGKKQGITILKIVFSDNTKIEIPITITNSNYKEPTAEIGQTKLYKNEKTTLSLYSGSENTSVTITVSHPENIKLGITNFNKNTQTYTVSLSKNTTKDISIEGISYIDNAYINVKYPEGKTYKIMLSVVESKIERLEGIAKDGNNFILKDGLYANKDILEQGFITGYTNGTFGALNNITREEFGVILSRIISTNKSVATSDYFSDVLATWSKDGIAKLATMGIVMKGNSYRPNDYITRYEVAEMLYNAVDLSNYSTTCPLSDVDSSVLGKKIAKCYNAGIIAGYSNGTFGGTNTITRAEVVVMMDRIFYSDLITSKHNIFSDLSPNYWAYSYILKASKN